MVTHPLVDVHVHLYRDRAVARRAREGYEIWEYGEDPGVHFDDASGVVDELADRYDGAGFDHAVAIMLFDSAAERAHAIAQLPAGLSVADRHLGMAAIENALIDGAMAANAWLVDAAAAHSKLTAYVEIDPCLVGSGALVDHLIEMIDRGARGVKLHPVAKGFRPDDPRLAPIYDLCSELGIVVLTHSGPGHRAEATARPRDFASVAGNWPRLPLVLAHLGGAAFGETEAFAADFPNITFDLSEVIEWVGASNAPSMSRLEELIARIGPERVMLGSDFPWYDPVRTAEKVESLAGIGRAGRNGILGENAVRILGLGLDATE